jgi:hypothetical protein
MTTAIKSTDLITAIEKTALHHARKAKALKLAEMLAAEYPGIGMQPMYDEDDIMVASWAFDDGDDCFYQTTDAAVPELADVLEAAEEYGVDLEAMQGGEDEEKKPSGSIVPEEYRQRYREVSSTGQSNGDWLAEQLTADTHGIEGFSVDDFAAVLVANSVDQSGAWARLPESGQRGWVGRWRMNGRQQLEKLVALRGVYYGPNGSEHKPAAEWLAETRLAHAKWIAKQQKIEEAMRDSE